VTNAGGQAVTQNGIYAYNYALNNGTQRRTMSVDYAVQALYGSANYHIGRLAVGGSLRYDFGSARGQVMGSDLGGRIGTISRDMNGDGVISLPEQKVGYTPVNSPAPVRYDYHYLSWSAGVNYRVAEPFSVLPATAVAPAPPIACCSPRRSIRPMARWPFPRRPMIRCARRNWA
jgi:outer membrane receptor protein involved in Fe transport